MTEKPKPDALSLEQASQAFGVHWETVRREILRGHLKAFKVGGRWRVLRSDLRAYMDARTFTPSEGDGRTIIRRPCTSPQNP